MCVYWQNCTNNKTDKINNREVYDQIFYDVYVNEKIPLFHDLLHCTYIYMTDYTIT